MPYDGNLDEGPEMGLRCFSPQGDRVLRPFLSCAWQAGHLKYVLQPSRRPLTPHVMAWQSSVGCPHTPHTFDSVSFFSISDPFKITPSDQLFVDAGGISSPMAAPLPLGSGSVSSFLRVGDDFVPFD